ncbi:MAG: DUF2141 domain-containing protein [Fibrella sp.]|nr:DUF2141 domain-containing protein [Armatimonadota bacterium]
MKMKPLAILVIIGLAMLGPMLPSATVAQETAITTPGTLSVTFTRLRSNKGVLRVTLFDASKEGKGFPGDTKSAREAKVIELSQAVPAGGKETTVTFDGLASGTYAVAAFHDENSNNKMDTHWYGKPKEGSAASNDPRPKMRAPKWSEAKFELPETGKKISVSLWYP